MDPKLLDVVELKRNIPEEGLKRGRRGTIVEVYPPDHYEVEFCLDNGVTDAMLPLHADDFDVVWVAPNRSDEP
jgi:hypothetical protein